MYVLRLNLDSKEQGIDCKCQNCRFCCNWFLFLMTGVAIVNRRAPKYATTHTVVAVYHKMAR